MPAAPSGAGMARLDVTGTSPTPPKEADKTKSKQWREPNAYWFNLNRLRRSKRRNAASLNPTLLEASKMAPGLAPKAIIVRPRGFLDLRKTSCYGISTAIFIAAGITATQASTDLVCTNVVPNTFVVCSNYVKGVVCNVESDIGDAELSRHIIHRGNPSVRGVKRIKETGSIVVLFDGDVPSYIRVGQAIVRCYLFKKQVDVCSKCTRVGHRADVCPTSMVNVCHNCGAKDPKQEQSCHVRCKLCGKGHPTRDKACQ
ncbi:hypothetical protein HPB49_016040 [Dermacentor silvarum]|uniref:Uncharacterized protein n=1 Tax=Dermacentor silvarum TaxID=543639 RepID=A0ACB8CLM3_DERSI|nr:hypothetical protein HPB49_016040 [Dermacentor silvarum]